MEERKVIPFGKNNMESIKKSKEIGKKSQSVFSDIKNSVKYMIQSAQGKYSFETYLEVLSEFTDSEIEFGEKSGLKYIGGEVTFITSDGQDGIFVSINLEFQSMSGEWKLKEAKRTLEKSMFTQESIDRLETAQETRFDIEKPV